MTLDELDHELLIQRERLQNIADALEESLQAAFEKRLCTAAECENAAHTHPDDLHHSPMSDDYLITLLSGDIPND